MFVQKSLTILIILFFSFSIISCTDDGSTNFDNTDGDKTETNDQAQNCPPEMHWNDETHKCMPDVPTCPPGMYYDLVSDSCLPKADTDGDADKDSADTTDNVITDGDVEVTENTEVADKADKDTDLDQTDTEWPQCTPSVVMRNKWDFAPSNAVEGICQPYIGPDGFIYWTNFHWIYKINATDGMEVWQKNMGNLFVRQTPDPGMKFDSSDRLFDTLSSGSNDNTYYHFALDTKNGNELWRTTPCKNFEIDFFSDGTLLMSEDKLQVANESYYVQTTLNGVDPATGNEKWQYDLPHESDTNKCNSSKSIVSKNNLIIYSRTCATSKNVSIHALNYSDRTEKWNFTKSYENDAYVGYLKLHFLTSSQVIIFWGKMMYALNAETGDLQWSKDLFPELVDGDIDIDMEYELEIETEPEIELDTLDIELETEIDEFDKEVETIEEIEVDTEIEIADMEEFEINRTKRSTGDRNDIVDILEQSAAIVTDELTVILFGNQLLAIDNTDGTTKWKVDVGTVSDGYQLLKVKEDNTYLSYEQDFVAIDNKDGSAKWTFTTDTKYYSVNNLAFYGDSIFAVQRSSRTADKPKLMSLNKDTGKENWKYTLEAKYFSNPVLDANGSSLYIQQKYNQLIALNTDNNAKDLSELQCEPCANTCKDKANLGMCMADGSNLYSDALRACGTDFQCKDNQCEACISHASKKCIDGHPYWYDSCDREETQQDTCTSKEECNNGKCGPPCKMVCTSTTAGLTCGSGALTCNKNYKHGVLISMQCSYANGKSFSCTAQGSKMYCYGEESYCYM